MESSWEKLKGIALSQHQNHKQDDKRLCFRPCPKILDDFTQASKDMHDMRKCNDNIFYVAVAAANSASVNIYICFSDFVTCLIVSLHVLTSKFFRIHFRILKVFEGTGYLSKRSHIFQMITPYESILNQLQTMEELKQQCDGKRNMYQGLFATQREKERSRKDENVSSQHLQAASNEYEQEAICFLSCLKSLKEAQTRSFITQAVQHHATQISLFSKGLKSLEAVDLELRSVAEHRDNAYNSNGLRDHYQERCPSLSDTCNNSPYTLLLELKKHEMNLRANEMKGSSNIKRASEKLNPLLSSQKPGEDHVLPDPPSDRITGLVQSTMVRRSQDLYAIIDKRLTPSSAAAYPLPMPPQTHKCRRSNYVPLSDSKEI
ncbi:hypothetical protein MKW98_020082 [Papaver atlanticum]|uniref:Uncharacterized protein n=1 Tax=Papaver atlanticum TaxID=357466 RepID=A0AAD4S1A3_9MAGN|nr:hypothetical protein MKW98_020082 [Papaver atlanticum]